MEKEGIVEIKKINRGEKEVNTVRLNEDYARSWISSLLSIIKGIEKKRYIISLILSSTTSMASAYKIIEITHRAARAKAGEEVVHAKKGIALESLKKEVVEKTLVKATEKVFYEKIFYTIIFAISIAVFIYSV